MPINLRERFLKDAASIREGDPVNAMPDMLLGWLNDGEFRQSIRSIDASERRRLLAELGFEAFERDLGSYVSGLRNAASCLDYVWTKEEREEIFRRHCALLFTNLSDIVDFLTPESARERLAEVDYQGLEHLRDARRDGVGAMTLSIHQSHPAFAFRHPLVDGIGASAITHEPTKGPAAQSYLLDGLRERVELLPVSPAAVRPMLARLRANECVCIYADYLYEGTPSIASALFGRILPIASGAVHIAVRNRIPIIPVSVSRRWPPEEGGVEVRMFQAIRAPEGKDPATQAEILAVLLGVAMEGMIRRRPEHWRLWPTLPHRWES